MKSFWKKHWKWLVPTLAAAAALIVAGSLYFLGFRITYDPTIITNWDAVSACAAWVGVFVSIAAVIASIVAIFYAIRVPKEIADRQDKIELFEKRYDILQSFAKCRIFYLAMIEARDIPSIQNACCRLLEVQKLSDMTEKDFAKKAGEFQYIFNQIPFLFTGISDEAIAKVYDSLWYFLVVVVRGKPTDEIIEKRKLYLESAYEFNEKYFLKMIKETAIKDLH